MTGIPLKTCNNCGTKYYSPDDFLRNTSRWRVCESGHLWYNCACDSTSMILKGKFDWYSPNKAMSGQAQSIFNQVPQFKSLPRVPTAVMELQDLIQKDDATADKLATLAKHDPLLASEILSVANNLVTGRGLRIESLAHAISYIGISALKDIVLVAALKCFKINCKTFDQNQFWSHSFLVGRVTEFLGIRFKLKEVPDELYIVGSLCNIGKIVLAMCLPDVADKYAAEISDMKILGNWRQAEARNHGYPHTILGEIGAAFWGLSLSVSDSIAHHHRTPVFNEHSPLSLHEVVGFANQIAHWLSLQPHQMDDKLYRSYCARFKLSERQAESMINEMMSLKEAS